MIKNTTKTLGQEPNFYGIAYKNIKKQYSQLEDKEANALCREVIFAPKSYIVEIKEGVKEPISKVRENLADSIEKNVTENDFAPISLDVIIADMIESSSCETSSMNEYYRWIAQTQEILDKIAGGNVCKHHVDARKSFIDMSYDREAEILFCLSLYQAGDAKRNKDKIEMLQFKLARLREMRSMVRATPTKVNSVCKINRSVFERYKSRCQELVKEKWQFDGNINFKLNQINNHSVEDDDLSESFSFVDYVKNEVLYMMRNDEKDTRKRQKKVVEEKEVSVKDLSVNERE